MLNSHKSHKIDKWLILGILLIGLVLRTCGIGFGLPYEYHVDEDQYVRQAATMGSTGLIPANWFNPPLLKYIYLAEFSGLYVIGRLSGQYASVKDFGSQLSLDPTWLYLLARWTSVLMSTITIYLVYRIGVKAYSRTVGILSGFMMAIAFLPVREAHFAVNDSAATLWIVIILLAAIGIQQSTEWRWYILAGIALGLGFATKYHVLLCIPTILLAHFLSKCDKWNVKSFSKLLTCFAISVAVAIMVSPYFVLSIKEVWQDAYRLIWSGQYGFGGWEIDPSGGFLFYTKTLIWGLGWVAVIICIFGIMYAIFHHTAEDIVIISLPLILFVFLGRQNMYFGRFILPIIPSLFLLSTNLINSVAGILFQKTLPQRIFLVSVVACFSMQPVLSSIRFAEILNREDTRTIAKNWIEENIPEGAKVAMDWQFHTPPLSTREKPVAGSGKVFDIWYPDFTMGKGLSDHPLEWYRINGYEYLISSSFIYNMQLIEPIENTKRNRFYSDLPEQTTLLVSISPGLGHAQRFIFDEIYGPAISLWERERPGPTINIYKLKNQ